MLTSGQDVQVQTIEQRSFDRRGQVVVRGHRLKNKQIDHRTERLHQIIRQIERIQTAAV